MRTFTTDNKTISIFPCSESESPVIYLNTFLDESQKVYETAQATGCSPFTLVSVSDLDWNHDMAPWDSPAAFKKGEPFTGGADDYLRLLMGEIIPRAEKELPGPPAWRGIFPGFKEYIFSHEPKRRPDCIYFSLGDKEAKTRNPVLKTVQENTEEIQDFYQSKGIDTVFQLNPGNHFVQGIERTVAGIQWLLSR